MFIFPERKQKNQKLVLNFVLIFLNYQFGYSSIRDGIKYMHTLNTNISLFIQFKI